MTRFFGILFLLFNIGAVTYAAEPLTALNMITADAAFCLEVPHLDQTWKQVESSPLMQRLRALPAFKRFLESPGYLQWTDIEEKIAAQTGKKISTQLRALFGNSLVLAIYIPASGKPQGILVGEAIDAAAVDLATSTWNLIDPHSVVTTKTYQGHKYQQRRKQGSSSESLFYVSTGRWVAISDQETLLQDLIQRFMVITKSAGRPSIAASLSDSNSFQKNRQRLKPDAAAYVHIQARPWDFGLEEAAKDERGPINPAKLWKHVQSVSACLDLQNGAVCDAVVEMDTTNRPSNWSQIVATATNEPAWDHRIPSDVLVAVSGHLEIASLLNRLVNQTPPEEKAELAKNRRLAQSLLGGQDLFNVVLPTLAKDFCASVTLNAGRSSKRCVLDGSVSFTMNSPGDAKLLRDVAHGMETGLTALAVYFSVEGPAVVSVEHEQNETARFSWLSEAAPVPVSYGVQQQTVVVASSLERLRKIFELSSKQDVSSRLADHAGRYFPKANQLIWVDTLSIRQGLGKSSQELAQLFSRGSADEAKKFENRFEQVQAFCGLVDSLFVAGRIEDDHVRVTFGGGLDPK